MLNEDLQTEDCFPKPFGMIRITMLRHSVTRARCGCYIVMRNYFETTFARKSLRRRKCVYTLTARVLALLFLHSRSLIPPRCDHDMYICILQPATYLSRHRLSC